VFKGSVCYESCEWCILEMLLNRSVFAEM